jgi:hypothetical protein
MLEIASSTFFHSASPAAMRDDERSCREGSEGRYSASPAAMRDDETATNNVATPMRRRRDVFISARLPGGSRPKQE